MATRTGVGASLEIAIPPVLLQGRARSVLAGAQQRVRRTVRHRELEALDGDGGLVQSQEAVPQDVGEWPAELGPVGQRLPQAPPAGETQKSPFQASVNCIRALVSSVPCSKIAT